MPRRTSLAGRALLLAQGVPPKAVTRALFLPALLPGTSPEVPAR